MQRSAAAQEALDDLVQWILDSMPDEGHVVRPLEVIQTEFTVNVFLTRFTEDDPGNRYSFDAFEAMLNSPEYYGDEGDSPHPFGEAVFGSLKDYWLEATFGVFDVTFILHQDWINLGSYTVQANSEFYNWLDEVEDYIIANNIDISDDDFILNFHYPHIPDGEAENQRDHPGIVCGPSGYCTRATFNNIPDVPCAMASARNGRWPGPAHDWDPTFTHIGLAAHELGHAFGMVSVGGPGGNYLAGYGSVMGTGNNCGPREKGECPPLLGLPGMMDIRGGDLWTYLTHPQVDRAEVIDVTQDLNDHALQAVNWRHGEDADQNHYNILRFDSPTSDDVFFIEARTREPDENYQEFPDAYVFSPVAANEDPALMPKTNFYLWRWNPTVDLNNPQNQPWDLADVIDAGDVMGGAIPGRGAGYGNGKQLFPGYAQVTSITPYTAPNTMGYYGDQTGFGIENIQLVPELPVVIADFLVDATAPVIHITEYTTWGQGTYHIEDTLYIHNGATLVLDGWFHYLNYHQDCTLLFGPDAVLIVKAGGRIIAKGRRNDADWILPDDQCQQHPTSLVIFESADSSETWSGIYIEDEENNLTAKFKYCRISP